VEKLAVLSCGELEESKLKIAVFNRNKSKPLVQLTTLKEKQGDFYGLLKNAEMELLTENLKDVLSDKDLEGCFCYVTIPDSLIIYKCFKRPLDALPNFNNKEEKEAFQKLCLKENPDKKPLDNYQVTVTGVTELDGFAYINCAYVLRATVKAIEGAFANNKMPILAIEPNFYGLRRVLRAKFPTQPCIFSYGENYFWTNKQNIFSLNTVEQDEETNYQVLMAMRQKSFEKAVPWEQVAVVKTENLQVLPEWLEVEDREKDYLTLCAIGSSLRDVKIPGKDTGNEHGLKKLRKLFNR
jgi:hypothetical protein